MGQVRENRGWDSSRSDGKGEQQDGCKVYSGGRLPGSPCLISAKDKAWPGHWTGCGAGSLRWGSWGRAWMVGTSPSRTGMAKTVLVGEAESLCSSSGSAEI